MDLRLPPTYFWVSQKEFQVRISSISLFNLQGTKNLLPPSALARLEGFAALLRGCLFILPDSLSFVKLFFNFFRSFSCSELLNLNFSKLFVRFRWPTGQLIYNTTHAAPCQQVFSAFVNFIHKRWQTPARRRDCGTPPARAALSEYHRIPQKSTSFPHIWQIFRSAGRKSRRRSEPS